MELDIGMARLECRPLGFCLLNPIFAKPVLARCDHRLDCGGPERLRYGYQRHRCRIAPGREASRRDLLAHSSKAFAGIACRNHSRRYNRVVAEKIGQHLQFYRSLGLHFKQMSSYSPAASWTARLKDCEGT